MILFRLLALAYWLLLTVLLLVPNPAAVFFGLRPAQTMAGFSGIHFFAFLLLAVLIPAARFPLRRRVLWSMLVVYALLTESLQWFVPHRTVELRDYAQNLLGLGAGALLFTAWEALAACISRHKCRGSGPANQ
jgi:VanZ family protein